MRIIPKDEINTEAKSSLAGQCALRLYYDGNITFSRQASDLLNFTENKYFQLCENDNNEIFLVPNPIQGYKATKRKDKFCFIFYSKVLVKYISSRFRKEPSRGKPLEFLIKKSNSKADGNMCYRIVIQNNPNPVEKN
jgi:hypothetical protein